MSLALLTLEYPPDTGGIARYLFELVRASEGEIVPIRFSLSSKPFSWMGLVPRALSLAKTHRMILVSHVLPMGTVAWMARRLGGAPYVILLHGLDIRLATRSAWKRWLTHRILKGANLVCVNSKYTESLVREAFPEISCVVMTPAVENVELPSRQEARVDLQVFPQERVIVSIGRLVKRKGHDVLVDAFARMNVPARLVIIGSGEEESALKEHAKPLGDRVMFLTQVTDEERWKWLVASDVFALTLRDDPNDPEGFGIVFLEAGIAGLPVIAGRNGGATEAVVDGVTGFIVSSELPNEVARSLDELLLNTTRATRMGEAGRIRALKEFSWKERWLTFASHI